MMSPEQTKTTMFQNRFEVLIHHQPEDAPDLKSQPDNEEQAAKKAKLKESEDEYSGLMQQIQVLHGEPMEVPEVDFWEIFVTLGV